MLSKQREQINQIDQQLVKLLQQRFAVTDEVGQIKKQAGIPVLDATREALILDKIAQSVADDQMKEIIVRLYQHIMAESRQQQLNIQEME